LSPLVSKIQSSAGDIQTSLRLIERDNSNLRSEIENLNIQLRAGNEAAKQIAAWESWGQSVFWRITGRREIPHSPGDVRFRLDEALLAGVGQSTTARKLELLRAQKRLLASRPDRRFDRKATGPISVQSLLILVVAVRRIQSMTGMGQSLPVLASPVRGS
jgi:hypothetical protein